MVHARGVGETLSRGALIIVAAATFAIILLRASGAVAQAQTGEAREHYRRGTAAYNLGKYAEAAHEYELSYEATLDPALLFNVAQAYRLAGDRNKALTAYRSYVRSAPEGDKRELAEARIKEIETALNYEDPFASEDRPPVRPPPVPNIVSSEPATPPTVRPTRPLLVVADPPVAAPPAVMTVRSEPVASAEANAAPIYKRWWLWAAGAALVVTIVVVIVIASSGSSGATPPQTDLGTMRF
jgi:tetratricopeptide (TPR) repeat protein